MLSSDGTFTRILPFRASGDGSRANTSALMLDRFSLSPKISVKYCAIFFCWGTLQWFSMDRMTGYLSDSRTNCCSDTDEGPHKYSNKTISSVNTTWSYSIEELPELTRHPLYIERNTLNFPFCIKHRIWSSSDWTHSSSSVLQTSVLSDGTQLRTAIVLLWSVVLNDMTMHGWWRLLQAVSLWIKISSISLKCVLNNT